MVCVDLFFFFKQKTAYEMRISVWSSDVCSSDLVAEAFSARITKAKALNAFLVETPEHALAAADAADKARAAGETLKPLAGVPIGMKDLFCTKGVPSTAGSHILEGFTPPYESTVSQNQCNAVAGMLGTDRKSTRLNSSH